MTHLVMMPLLAFLSFIPQKQTAHKLDMAKANAWAKSVETTVTAGNPSVLNDTLDVDGLIRRVGLCIAPELRKEMGDKGWDEFTQGLRESLNEANTGTRIVEAATPENPATFTFLRMKPYRGRTTALFRHVMGDGLNYYLFFLEENDQGHIVYTDMYVYLAGETTSSSVCRMTSLILNQQLGVLDKLMGKEKERLEAFTKILDIIRLNGEGHFQKALDVYNGLPSEVQDEKVVQIARYTSASSLDEKTFTEVSMDILKRFEHDPSLYLLLIDGFTVSEKYEDALRCIDGLDKDLGGDSFLDTYRVPFYSALGQYDKALEASRRLIKDEALVIDGYAAMLDTYINKKDYEKVFDVVEEAKTKAEIVFNLDLLKGDPSYNDFFASEAYKKHKAAQTAE